MGRFRTAGYALTLLSGMLFIACSGGGGGGGGGTPGDAVITIAAIPGVVVPVRDAEPDTSAIETEQYTGTITWSPDHDPFRPGVQYSAIIELSPKAGYTLNGVTENFFTVAGAAATNAIDSGIVTAVFPATGAVSDIDVVFQSAVQTGGVSGTTTSTALTLTFSVDPTTLTADNITVTGATKGALSGSGTTRSLAISDITVLNGETVTVTITSPAGYAISGSPKTAVVYRSPVVVSIAAISGVAVPVRGETPVTSITETAQYTGTVIWSPSHSTFAASTVYTATIALTAKFGYTLNGVAANFFTVAGATSDSNSANSGVVTAEFPATGAAPDIDVVFQSAVQTGGVSGTTTSTALTLSFDVDPTTLTADNISVTGATKGALSGSGTTRSLAISDITVANGATVSVTITSPAGYAISGSPKTAVVYKAPAVVSLAAISGVTPPAYGATPVTSITETAQYTGTVSWSPSHSTFAATTVYTATITLTAKSGYTLNGVAANFFTVAGAASDSNSANSGVVTAEFPATAAAAAESGFTGASTVGQAGTISVGTETVDMIYANNQTTIVFPFSPTAGTPVDNNPATLTRKFFMSETQVTNALMAEVLQWAYNNGKFSTTVGNHNGLDSTTVKHGTQKLLYLDGATIKINYSGGSFTVDSGYEDHPVVCVTWYGSIMFCNWLTEMRDGNTTNVVYTGIDTTWDHTETVENAGRNGYRLPSSQEWEYAARYIGTTAPTGGSLATEYVARNVRTGHATLTAGYYWTPADYASGAIRDCNNETETRTVAWYIGDPAMGGLNLMPVSQKAANKLGLYDMSGNVMEWCFTADGTRRVSRGGGYANGELGMQVGRWDSNTPISRTDTLGFRFARTQ